MCQDISLGMPRTLGVLTQRATNADASECQKKGLGRAELGSGEEGDGSERHEGLPS
jgi:hypothetical protein